MVVDRPSSAGRQSAAAVGGSSGRPSKGLSNEASRFCELCGKLLVAQWSRRLRSVLKEQNEILFAAASAFKTWTGVVESCLPPAEEKSSGRDEFSAEQVETSYLCLTSLAKAAGRRLWLDHHYYVDQLYRLVKPAIVGDLPTLQLSTYAPYVDSLCLTLLHAVSAVFQTLPTRSDRRDIDFSTSTWR